MTSYDTSDFPQWLQHMVTGPMPQGIPDALRRCADAWAESAQRLRETSTRLEELRSGAAAAAIDGATGAGLRAGIESQIRDTGTQIEFHDQVAALLYEAANQIELAQYLVYGTAAALLIQLAVDIAMANAPKAAYDRVQAKIAMQLTLRDLIRNLGQLLRMFALGQSRLAVAARSTVLAGSVNGSVHVAAQYKQVREGNRESVDWRAAGIATAAAGVAGLVGAEAARVVAPVVRRAAAGAAPQALVGAQVAGVVVTGAVAGTAAGFAGGLLVWQLTGGPLRASDMATMVMTGFGGGLIGATGGSLRVFRAMRSAPVSVGAAVGPGRATVALRDGRAPYPSDPPVGPDAPRTGRVTGTGEAGSGPPERWRTPGAGELQRMADAHHQGLLRGLSEGPGIGAGRGDARPPSGGSDPLSGGSRSEAAGSRSEAVGPRSEAVGPRSEAVGPRSEAVGPRSEAVGPRSEAVGPRSEAVGPRVVIGHDGSVRPVYAGEQGQRASVVSADGNSGPGGGTAAAREPGGVLSNTTEAGGGDAAPTALDRGGTGAGSDAPASGSNPAGGREAAGGMGSEHPPAGGGAEPVVDTGGPPGRSGDHGPSGEPPSGEPPSGEPPSGGYPEGSDGPADAGDRPFLPAIDVGDGQRNCVPEVVDRMAAQNPDADIDAQRLGTAGIQGYSADAYAAAMGADWHRGGFGSVEKLLAHVQRNGGSVAAAVQFRDAGAHAFMVSRSPEGQLRIHERVGDRVREIAPDGVREWKVDADGRPLGAPRFRPDTEALGRWVGEVSPYADGTFGIVFDAQGRAELPLAGNAPRPGASDAPSSEIGYRAAEGSVLERPPPAADSTETTTFEAEFYRDLDRLGVGTPDTVAAETTAKPATSAGNRAAGDTAASAPAPPGVLPAEGALPESRPVDPATPETTPGPDTSRQPSLLEPTDSSRTPVPGKSQPHSPVAPVTEPPGATAHETGVDAAGAGPHGTVARDPGGEAPSAELPATTARESGVDAAGAGPHGATARDPGGGAPSAELPATTAQEPGAVAAGAGLHGTVARDPGVAPPGSEPDGTVARDPRVVAPAAADSFSGAAPIRSAEASSGPAAPQAARTGAEQTPAEPPEFVPPPPDIVPTVIPGHIADPTRAPVTDYPMDHPDEYRIPRGDQVTIPGVHVEDEVVPENATPVLPHLPVDPRVDLPATPPRYRPDISGLPDDPGEGSRNGAPREMPPPDVTAIPARFPAAHPTHLPANPAGPDPVPVVPSRYATDPDPGTPGAPIDPTARPRLHPDSLEYLPAPDLPAPAPPPARQLAPPPPDPVAPVRPVPVAEAATGDADPRRRPPGPPPEPAPPKPITRPVPGADETFDDEVMAALSRLSRSGHPVQVLGETAGNNNINVTIRRGAGLEIARFPIPGADVMDLRIAPEPAIMRWVAPYVAVPQLLSEHQAPDFAIYEYVYGRVLDEIAPRGQPVPAHVPGDIAGFFAGLRRAPRPTWLPRGWSDDPVDLARALTEVTWRVYTENAERYGDLYRQLGVSAEWLRAVFDGAAVLENRPPRILHADAHRKNLIIRDRTAAGELIPPGERATVAIDWELALYGDPLYDVAVHLHKMGYLPGEETEFLARWSAAEPEAAIGNWRRDLDFYRNHERAKSLVVESVRYAKQIASGNLSRDQENVLVDKLVDKVHDARVHIDRDETQVARSRIEHALRTEPETQEGGGPARDPAPGPAEPFAGFDIRAAADLPVPNRRRRPFAPGPGRIGPELAFHHHPGNPDPEGWKAGKRGAGNDPGEGAAPEPRPVSTPWSERRASPGEDAAILPGDEPEEPLFVVGPQPPSHPVEGSPDEVDLDAPLYIAAPVGDPGNGENLGARPDDPEEIEYWVVPVDGDPTAALPLLPVGEYRVRGTATGTEMPPEHARALHRIATDVGEVFEGNGNRVHVVGDYAVRVPKQTTREGAGVDYRLWPDEYRTVEALMRTVVALDRPHLVPRLPQILYVEFDAEGNVEFEIHRRIADPPPADLMQPAARTALRELGELFAQVPVPQDLLPLPENYPESGDSAGFFHLLVDRLEQQYGMARRDPRYAGSFAALGYPESITAGLASMANSVRSQPFQLLHGDITRSNFLGQVLTDFELALYGPFDYELAVLLHRDSGVVLESHEIPAELYPYVALLQIQRIFTDTVRLLEAIEFRGLDPVRAQMMAIFASSAFPVAEDLWENSGFDAGRAIAVVNEMVRLSIAMGRSAAADEAEPDHVVAESPPPAATPWSKREGDVAPGAGVRARLRSPGAPAGARPPGYPYDGRPVDGTVPGTEAEQRAALDRPVRTTRRRHTAGGPGFAGLGGAVVFQHDPDDPDAVPGQPLPEPGDPDAVPGVPLPEPDDPDAVPGEPLPKPGDPDAAPPAVPVDEAVVVVLVGADHASVRELLRNNPLYRTVFASNVITRMGDGIMESALPYVVLTTTGSPAQAALAMALIKAPGPLFGILAGYVGDFFDPRRTMVVGQAIGLAATVVGGGLVVVGAPGLGVGLMVAALIEGIASTFYLGATDRVVMRDAVSEREQTAAHRLVESEKYVAGIAGRSLGPIMAGVSHALPYVANGVSYVVNLVALRRMHRSLQVGRPKQAETLRGRLADLGRGFVVLWREPTLRVRTATVTVTNAAFGLLALRTTVVVEAGASSWVLGLVLGAGAAGGVAGASLPRRIVGLPLKRSMLYGLLTWTGITVGMAASTDPIALAAGTFAIGVVGVGTNMSYNKHVNEVVPKDASARTRSANLVVTGVGATLGSALGGTLVTITDITTTGWVGAAAVGALAAGTVASRLAKRVKSAFSRFRRDR